MLEYLVGVDHVERVVFEFQLVDVADFEREVRQRPRLGRLSRALDDLVRAVDAHDAARGDEFGQVHRDGPGSAADVEQTVAALQMREEEAG